MVAEPWRELYPFTSRYLELPAGRLHYVDEMDATGDGAGTSVPVVAVHGNPSWSFYYRRLIERMRRRCRVVALDHLGCGLSDKPTDDRYDYTLTRRVHDLDRLLDHLALERVSLVVHDWGGMIGLSWAVRNVERVHRLVVLNTAAFPLPSGRTFPRVLTLARVPGLSALLVRGLGLFNRGANRWCVKRAPMSKATASGYLAPYRSWHSRRAVHRFVQDIPLGPRDRSWSMVQETANGLAALADKPMLIGWGLLDFVFDRAFLAEWQRRFPAADSIVLPDAGHYVLEDAAEELLPAIESFLMAQ